MVELDVVHTISSDLLDVQYYFQSLIEQAMLCGLLSDSGLAKIQWDLLAILAEQTDKWSRGKSSSIPTEKAKEIMNSVMFVIGIQLKSYQMPEQAIDMLKTESLKQLFESGMKLVKQKMMIARRLQKRIMDNLFETPNVYYRSTIFDGINGFFKLYRPQFAAHEIHITADYPVYIGRPRLNGIEFIEQYLRCIEAENAFCICFAAKDVHHLLSGLTKDYPSVPMNIFEPVLLSALGLSILKHDPIRLDLSKEDILLLYREFTGKSDIEIQECLRKSSFLLYRAIKLPQNARHYIDMCIPKLANAIQNGVMMKTLDKVFLTPAYPELETKIILSYGDRMNDGKYQKLLEKILQTDQGEERINIVLKEVHSLADLLDIISDAELYEDEIRILVDMLPYPVFDALLLKYPDDDFLYRESDILLYKALQNRKKTI